VVKKEQFTLVIRVVKKGQSRVVTIYGGEKWAV